MVAPLDPPRSGVLCSAQLVCAFAELFTSNPRLVYQIVYAVSLTTFLVASLYAARAQWDAAAGHAACLFILTSGALTSRLVNHVDRVSHVAFLLAAGPALLFTVLALREPTRRRMGLGVSGEMGSPALLRDRRRCLTLRHLLHQADLPLHGQPVAAYRANGGDVYYLFSNVLNAQTGPPAATSKR